MKIKRYKRVQRYLNLFVHNFGFRVPFQVLVDGTFCQAALTYKVNIKEQMPKYFGSEVKLFTTVCVVEETEKLGSALYGAMLVVKQFPVRICGHEKNPISASRCLYSMVKENNSDHYFLATQDPELSQKVRSIPGCPLLYLKYNAINLEKPSEISEETANIKMQDKANPPDYQLAILHALKKELGETANQKRKRKRIKGPNPLSCKKRKQKTTETNREITEKKQRKRHRRLKIAKHVKEHLSNTNV